MNKIQLFVTWDVTPDELEKLAVTLREHPVVSFELNKYMEIILRNKTLLKVEKQLEKR